VSSGLQSTLKLPLPDQVIAGRYRIISRLGSGGMGLVYLAEHVGVGNKVALKFLDPEPSEDDSRIARFLREAKVGLAVQHPGAAQILDLGRDEANRLFLCFELVEGEDLRELLKREGRLRFGEARSIAMQVGQALAFAHSRNIVHRDVKPENIRVRRDLAGPHVKVLDFGIARLLKDAGVRLTADGMLAGTPRYMAPEQVKDEPLDGRVDQYALGLVLFEMLTGSVAMNGKNISQILLHQIQNQVPPLAMVDPQLDNGVVDAFIARACAKEPQNRFPTMADFIAALKNLRIDEYSWPAAAQPPQERSSPQRPTRDGKANPWVDLSNTVASPDRTQVGREQQGGPNHSETTVPDHGGGKNSLPPSERPTQLMPSRSALEAVKAASGALGHLAPSSPLPPTDPEHPAVPRAPAPPATSHRRWWVLGLMASSMLGVAAWWWSIHST
jgi:serine/threonine protein kinase